MRKLFGLLAVLLIAAVSLWSQEGADLVEPKKLSRGDTVSITVKNVPDGVKATKIKFDAISGGKSWIADKPEQKADAAEKNKVAVSSQIPADAPLANYRASVSFDNGKVVPAASLLSVQPPGGGSFHLNEFTPPNTYDSEEVWTQKRIATRTVDLTLHGSGFIPPVPDKPSDNIVWINKIPAKITWDTCADKPSKGAREKPVTLETHGEFVSPQEIRLCRIPVPDDGEMQIAVGAGDVQSETRVFRVFSMTKAAVAWRAAGVALLMALLPLSLLTFAKGSYAIDNQPYKLRMLFLDPETDTYSLSKLQFYLWTVASIFAYAYLFISFVNVQHLPWPDVPGTLPGIIAVAAGTAVGSQLISANKGSKGAGEQSPSLSDFITSGGVVAPDRLQMLLWTIIGVGAFFVAVLDSGPGTISELPAVPERLLYLMGISSAGYLGGKMARAAGPVINEISITPAESDAALAKGTAPATVLPNLVAATTAAQTDLSSFPAVTNFNATVAITSLSDAIKAAGAAQTVSELSQLVDTLRTLKAKAEQGARDAAGDFQAKKATQAEAETAQKAASTLQDFSANVMQAISAAGANSMQFEEHSALNIRSIELRGTNMSSEGLVEIDHADLPFRMLLNKDGQHAPEIVIREDATPRFARLLRLTIDPARLGTSDLTQFQNWFGADGAHSLTLTNPDGQKAEISFSVPPGEAQKVKSV